MIFKCPRCGKEYCISNVPDTQMILRCVDHNCRHVFTIAQAEIVTADDSARIEEEKKVMSAPVATDMEQFLNDHEGMAKALAQDYFSDIPGDNAGETESQAPVTEDQGEGTPEQQRQRLYQFAQEHPGSQTEERAAQPQARRVLTTRYVHEKKGQLIGCYVLQFFALLIFAGRIVLTRLQGAEQHFKYLQPQIIPSAMYFCAALMLIVHLMRYTARPKGFSAVLMLLPLILDAWYLFPQTLNIMPADTWFMVNCGVKIAFALFGLLRSVHAGRRPAKKYHSALT